MVNYYIWLTDMIKDSRHSVEEYSRVLRHLYDREFSFSPDVPKDENRWVDGLQLRGTYENQYGAKGSDPFSHIDGQCSVLEMMIALAMRCDSVAGDPRVGDQTAKWFWCMMENLDLHWFTNDRYKVFDVDTILEIMLNREYDCFGHGGLFPCESSKVDMRKLELWVQMNYWIEEKFPVTF